MIFSTLYDSNQRGELILIDGGFCHWHLCTIGHKRGQITIREIISQRNGAGQEMLAQLCGVPGATSLFAKCPSELPANAWYARRGFVCEGQEVTRGGAVLNLWRLPLPATETFPYRQPQCLWRRRGGHADPWGDAPWQGDCGILWTVEGEHPSDHLINYCPFCGRPVLVVEGQAEAGSIE